MKSNDRVTSIIFGAIGIYVAVEGYYLELGTLQKPKPGFLVFWAGIIFAGLSLLLLIQTFTSKVEKKESIWQGVKWQRGLILNIILIAYILSFQKLGFVVSTFFLLIFLFKSLDSQRWKVAFLLSIIATAVSFFIFGYFLEVQFPQGILKGWY